MVFAEQLAPLSYRLKFDSLVLWDFCAKCNCPPTSQQLLWSVQGHHSQQKPWPKQQKTKPAGLRSELEREDLLFTGDEVLVSL